MVHGCKNKGICASLDVESLFTNVPVQETISIICRYVYNHSTLLSPRIPEDLLKQILTICTSESPFQHPNNLYLQVDGVAMGSPLGPTFANFYMGNLETTVLLNFNPKPLLYARYVDDIFLLVENESDLFKLRDSFEEKSVLHFTVDLNHQNKQQVHFLDTLITSTESVLKTKI